MNLPPPQDGLFGRVSMGYVLVHSERIDAWQTFVLEGLGLHADRLSPDLLACRTDGHARRLIVQRGAAEDVAAIGWQVADEAALKLLLSRFAQRHIAHERVQGEEAALRGVACFWRVKGPKGLATEFFVEATLSDQPLTMKSSGFVTGALGMGHVAITSRNPRAMEAFWRDVLDARVSDHIEDRIDGVDLEFTFLRLNARHHSVATAATRGVRLNPVRTQIHHLNLQAAQLSDVTQAYLRCRAMGLGIANGIGQHPNDKELSFYVVTPSGFEIEMGWDPLTVDEAVWMPTTYRGISLWGHRPENLSLPVRLGRVRQGLSSLLSTEYVPEGIES